LFIQEITLAHPDFIGSYVKVHSSELFGFIRIQVFYRLRLEGTVLGFVDHRIQDTTFPKVTDSTFRSYTRQEAFEIYERVSTEQLDRLDERYREF